MNEQIQLLAEQATIRVNNPFVNSDGKVVCDDWEQGVSLSKFAELIVAECCQVLSKETIRHDGYGYNQHALYQKIKEHFGIEQ